MSHIAYKFETDVGPGGKLDVTVPLPEGTHVEVVILSSGNGTCDDLAAAASSSMDFWDNPQDDQDWNNA